MKQWIGVKQAESAVEVIELPKLSVHRCIPRPSSNRTGGFPASGFGVDERLLVEVASGSAILTLGWNQGDTKVYTVPREIFRFSPKAQRYKVRKSIRRTFPSADFSVSLCLCAFVVKI
jgi:hypothetical protein